MRTNALSVANYFIDLAQKEGKPIHLLGLVKRVYIAHGFALALLNRGLLDPRFDKVEAWRYGPVIPSVYHSFKQNCKNPIKKHTVMMHQDKEGNVEFLEPTITDAEEQMVIKMVWDRYINYTGSQLVELTHRPGTPWGACYVPNENREIPDSFTKLFYSKLVNVIINERTC